MDPGYRNILSSCTTCLIPSQHAQTAAVCPGIYWQCCPCISLLVSGAVCAVVTAVTNVVCWSWFRHWSYSQITQRKAANPVIGFCSPQEIPGCWPIYVATCSCVLEPATGLYEDPACLCLSVSEQRYWSVLSLETVSLCLEFFVQLEWFPRVKCKKKILLFYSIWNCCFSQ